MDTLSALALGFEVALRPENLLIALIGSFLGTVIGALPGIGPVNGIAIMIPVCFALGLDPVSSLIMLCSIYYGCMYGGRIASITLGIPGDEAAVMATLDGFPMAQKGKATVALIISGVGSFFGGTVATIGLTLFAPALASLAIYFGPSEYVALFIMAFLTVGGVATKHPTKTLLAVTFGLALSTIGADSQSGIPRYTFDILKLYDGINYIVVIVGAYAIGEYLSFLEEKDPGAVVRPKMEPLKSSYRNAWNDLQRCWGAILRSSGIGFIIGILPGAGPTLASYLGYVTEKKISDKDGTFGTGDPRGVAAPETADNAAAGGAMVPMLTLGIPGSGGTAIMLAMLMSLNITPGPLLFERQPEIVWGLIAALYISNVMLVVMNIPLVGFFVKMLQVPPSLLMPVVMVFAIVGVYSINNVEIDIFLMIAFGVVGHILRKAKVPIIPIILGLLLGDELENALRRAIAASGGDWTVLFDKPIAVGIYAFTLVAILASIWLQRRGKRMEGAT